MKQIAWMVVAVVILGGAYWWWQSTQAPAANTGTDSGIVDTGAGSQVPVDTGTPSVGMTATVTYDGSSFSPAEVTIKKGGAVTFTSTGVPMWVASGPHPAHTNYSGSTLAQHCPDTSNGSFDQCAVANSYTFVFDKVGTWPYHNHVKLGAYGKVIVVE